VDSSQTLNLPLTIRQPPCKKQTLSEAQERGEATRRVWISRSLRRRMVGSVGRADVADGYWWGVDGGGGGYCVFIVVV
jgi:hypothetical protein